MYKYIKRVADFILSFTALLLLSPFFIVIAVLIKLESKGPIFFKQKRVTKGKKYFQIYKFRTMYIDAPKNAPTHLLENPERFITRSGKFLRKSSLDELPQLINIIKGEMSIIGPRPALWNQYDLIEERDKYGANDVLPGLSGWAQINGRDELPIEVKSRLDGEYVKHLSLIMDVKCFFWTIISVIRHDGVLEGGKKYTASHEIENNERSVMK